VCGETEIARLDVFVPSNHGDFYARVAHLGEDDWDRGPYVPKLAKLPRTDLEVKSMETLDIKLLPCRPRDELLERLEAVALDAQAIAQAPTEALEKAKQREIQREKKARTERVSKLRRAGDKKPAAKKSTKKQPRIAERKRRVTKKKKKTAKRARRKSPAKAAPRTRKLAEETEKN
jgi:hypothetical protein